MGVLIFVIGFLGMIFFIVKLIIDIIKKKPKKKELMGIGLSFVLFIVGAMVSDDATNKNVTATNKQNVTAKEETKADVNVTGDLDIKFTDDKAIATVKTNAIDETLIEISIIDTSTNMVTDVVKVKNGKAIKEFALNDKWEVGYLSGVASIRFNLEEHQQSDIVKKAYGENGEKLEGELATVNNVNGKNIALKTKTVAYPDTETVKAKQSELFDKAKVELIKASNGIVLDIKPRFDDGNWGAVTVVISDVWYNSQEHEKERFAEQISSTVTTLVVNTEKVDPNDMVMVYLLDTYDKELATPKFTGGYKIKR